MAITYTQSIKSMEALKSSGSFDNVIYKVNWKMQGNSGSFRSLYVGEDYLDTTNISESDFINYANTPAYKEIVFSWITGSVDESKEAISENITLQLESSNNDEVLTFS
jgi:hypothetical protein